MPELPEVEIVKRGLEPALRDQKIVSVNVRRADLRVPVPHDFKTKIEERSVVSIIRRGKYILVFLDSGDGFVLHLGMSGRIHIYGPDQDYQLQKHDHLVFKTGAGTAIVFNDTRRFGMAFLIGFQNWEAQKPFATMGPEPLGNDFNGPALAGKLKNRRTAIKAALLDQKIVAGIGNIYACEALYHAGINPERAANTIQGREAGKLAGAVCRVLQDAIQAGGSSLRDYQHTDGNLGYFQTCFSVYDREGKSCPDCACDIIKTGGVRRSVQSGRSTFFCSARQQ